MPGSERCEYCGRFMTQRWALSGDESDGWEDYWVCSQQRKHIADHPQDWELPDAG